MDHFLTLVALIGLVIVAASLASGALDRCGVPVVGAFLLLGVAAGPAGLGILDIGFESAALHALATLGLALMLFSDAVTLERTEFRRRRALVWRLLVPGTLAPALVTGFAAWGLLGLSAPLAAILGAAIASTDPVLLRGMLRSPALPETPRIALRIETGMNDMVLLPIVAVAILVVKRDTGAGATGVDGLGRLLVGLFLLGPALGALVGWAGISALSWVRRRSGVRRDYESLYALGLAFTAYAAAEAVGGSGFVAAFAAGLLIAGQDDELCDCFLEYGQATAEMLLLLTFVALGASLIWTGLGVIDWRTILFAAIALAIRTVVLFPILARAKVHGRDRRLIALYGPRGLSTLLLALLPVFAGVPGAERVFAVASLVVLLSIVLHGGAIATFVRSHTHRAPPLLAPGGATSALGATETITLAQLGMLRERDEEIVIVDSRTERALRSDPRSASGSVRIDPDDPVRDATEKRLSQRATLVVYCA